jgi:hypothetical protein
MSGLAGFMDVTVVVVDLPAYFVGRTKYEAMSVPVQKIGNNRGLP